MISCEIKGEGRRLAVLLFSLGLLQIAGYYLAGAWVNGPGPLASPQPDTLLYCQSARRIVEGHPFSFTTGNAVSTGTTSVLYPFVLAIPYVLGFVGGKLISAGFFVNAIFYLTFLFGWALAFRRWLSPKTAFFASVLLAVFPQTAYCAMAQSDTGMWMAVSALVALAFASGKTLFMLPLLCLGPWVRPEGTMLAVALLICGMLSRRRRAVAIAALALLSAVGVFCFNCWLTGASGFSSVSNKGFFSVFTFAQAVKETSIQLMAMSRELFVGQAFTYPRLFYSIPFVGAVVSIIGFATFFRVRDSRQFPVVVFGLAALADVAVVAQSGWQGSNSDRYLAWTMPIFVLFGAVGWAWMRERFSGFSWSSWILGVPVAYYAAASLCLMVVFYLRCDETERSSRFASEIDRIIPANSSVGVISYSGLAYYLGDRRVANICGIYSPEFQCHGQCAAMELLKNEPAIRFDYWLFMANDYPASFMATQGGVILSGPDASGLKKTNWAPFDVAAKVPEIDGKQLKDRVDVCYEKDEKRSNYEIVFSYGMQPFDAVLHIADLGGKTAVDCGRIVAGYDEMDVGNLVPGKDVSIVLRVCDQVKAVSRSRIDGVVKTEFSFAGENGMHLTVDGREVACRHAHVSTNCFSDVVLKLPGKFVTSAKHRIGFHGDHVAFGYWFFQ